MKSKSYQSNHALEILTKLNDDRIKVKNYCDVTLTAGSNDFSVHKCVLGIFSNFFLKMFSIEMKEKYESKGNIQGITEETLEAVISFIYTCNIIITSDNVYDLIEAANYMSIPHLKEFCLQFLLEEIDVTNCLKIRAYSKLYSLDKLVEKTDFVIAEHFESLVNKKEFNEVKFEHIKEIFEIENKVVTSEETVFHSMVQWIKHDLDVRRQFLAKLFSLLDLRNLSGDFLQDVVGQENLIKNNNECMFMCFQSVTSRYQFQQKSQAIAEQKKAEKHLLAFTGNKVWKYDVRSAETCDFPQITFPHQFGSAVHHKGKVYVIGGRDCTEVEKLDLNDQALGWTQLASVDVKRDGCASTVFDDFIYNCGGANYDTLILGNVNEKLPGQCYNIKKNNWKTIDDMNEIHRYGALVSTSQGIYAIGGCSATAGNLKTVEFHDPRQGGWKHIPSMKVARQGVAAVVLNDKVYAIGGYDAGHLNSVEVFDPSNQTWCDVAPMNFARFYHGACVLNGKIYVIGGGSTAVEVYDPKRKFWVVDANVPEFESVQFVVAIQSFL